MLPRVFVSNELHCPSIKVLLGKSNAFPKSRRYGLVKDFHTSARAFVNLNSIEARVLFTAAWADAPNLARF
jgi:hypothetical protein